MRDFFHQMGDTMEAANNFRVQKLKVGTLSYASCVAVYLLSIYSVSTQYLLIIYSVREAAVAHHPGHAAHLVPGLDTLRSHVPCLGSVTPHMPQNIYNEVSSSASKNPSESS